MGVCEYVRVGACASVWHLILPELGLPKRERPKNRTSVCVCVCVCVFVRFPLSYARIYFYTRLLNSFEHKKRHAKFIERERERERERASIEGRDRVCV